MSPIPKTALAVGLAGRTGNQMFQYAAGRAAALRQGLDLLLDTRLVDKVETLSYALDSFPIKARPAGREELPPLKTAGLPYRFWKVRSRFTGQRIVEARNAFTKKALYPSGGTELKGYWQNEAYFRDQAETIRTELTPSVVLATEDQKLAEKIAASECSVSVHVRRTDYVKLADWFVLLGPDYFNEASERMAAQLGRRAQFFVFSDDPDWVNENINLPGETHFVRQHSGTTANGDLLLMSRCQHHIIANSTFSWWGAWLNPRPDKIVVAPRTWYAGDWLSSDFILPPDWIAQPVPGH
jgi:hypothetical protein